MTKSLIKIAGALIFWRLAKQIDISLFTTEAEYIAASNTVKNMIITHEILIELEIILKDFAFSILINCTEAIAISEEEKVTKNARYINICYHHV